MKDDQKMKHKKYKQQTTHQEQPDQMSPSNQSDWMQPGRSKSCNGEILLEGSLYTILDEKQKTQFKNFDQRFCHLDRGRGSSRFTVC